MRQIHIITFLSFYSLFSQAQTVMNKDSLLRLLKTKKDTALVKVYFDLASECEGRDLTKAKEYSNLAYKLSKNIGYTNGIINHFALYSSFLDYEGKYDESIALNLKAVKLSIAKKDNYRLGCSYFNIAKTYQYKEDFTKSIIYYQYAKNIFQKEKTDKFDATLLMNLGVLYNNIAQYEKSLSNLSASEKICRIKNDNYTLCMVLVNKTDTEMKLKKNNSAKKSINEAIVLAKELKDDVFLQAGIITLCDIKLLTNDFDDIYNLSQESLKLSTKLNIIEGVNKSLRGLATYYFYKKDYKLAKNYATQAMDKIVNEDYVSDKISSALLLSDIYLAQNDLANYKKNRIIADSLTIFSNIKESRKLIQDMETKYESEKNQLQIKTLTQQNELQDLKIKRRLWTTITLFLAFLGLGAFAYSQFKNFKTKKALLVAQQENAIAEERLRIASDMHDDVGSGLSRIRYIVGAVQNGQTEQKQGLTKVTEISDDAVQKMKEIIWSLNESNQNLEDLIYYIRGQMSEMVENGNVNFVCHLPENIPSVFFGWKRNRNTYLLVKESINNALKHAEAKTITLDFIIANDLKITVTDDGKGFDTTKNFNRNGLNNYKKRVADLNAKYELKSEIDKGTTFWFQLPIGVS